jgi:hypothetical protein
MGGQVNSTQNLIHFFREYKLSTNYPTTLIDDGIAEIKK